MVSKYQKFSLLLYQLLCQYRIHFQKCSLVHFKPQNLEHLKQLTLKRMHTEYIPDFLKFSKYISSQIDIKNKQKNHLLLQKNKKQILILHQKIYICIWKMSN